MNYLVKELKEYYSSSLWRLALLDDRSVLQHVSSILVDAFSLCFLGLLHPAPLCRFYRTPRKEGAGASGSPRDYVISSAPLALPRGAFPNAIPDATA